MLITNGYDKKVFIYKRGDLSDFYDKTKSFSESFRENSRLKKGYLLFACDYQEAHNIYHDVIGSGGLFVELFQEDGSNHTIYKTKDGLKIIII